MGRARVAPQASSGSAELVAPDPAAVARWRARLDALTRWCLSELALAPTVHDALPAARPTLGDLLRRALGRDGAGVVDLLDALDAAATPAARALLGRVLGADLLLVVITARDGALARADARACRTPSEARALVDAFLGASAPAWVAEFGIADAAGTRAPALACGIDGQSFGGTGAAPSGQHPGGELTVVLPFLPLDGQPAAAAAAPDPVPNAAPAVDPFAVPAILGGTLRPGAAFLDAPPSVGGDEETDEADAEWSGHDRDEGADEGADADQDAEDDDASDEADDGPHDPSAEALAFLDDGFAAAFASAPDADVEEADAEADTNHAAAVDHGGALDRLRARTSAAAQRVSVLIATDDGVAEHVADAAAWLAEASEQELRALARGGWTGDAAVEVALALAEDDPEALDVVQLARRHEAELVVEVDGRAASAWLACHRPDAARRLGALVQ